MYGYFLQLYRAWNTQYAWKECLTGPEDYRGNKVMRSEFGRGLLKLLVGCFMFSNFELSVNDPRAFARALRILNPTPVFAGR